MKKKDLRRITLWYQPRASYTLNEISRCCCYFYYLFFFLAPKNINPHIFIAFLSFLVFVYCLCIAFAAHSCLSYLFFFSLPSLLDSLSIWEIIRHTKKKKKIIITAEEATAWRIRLQHLHEQRKPLLSPQFSKSDSHSVEIVLTTTTTATIMKKQRRWGAPKRNIRTKSVPMPYIHSMWTRNRETMTGLSIVQKIRSPCANVYIILRSQIVWLTERAICIYMHAPRCCSNGDCCWAKIRQ